MKYKRVYSWWQNLLFALSILLIAAACILVVFVVTSDVRESLERNLLRGGAFIGTLSASGYLAVRAARTGISVENGEVIKIRSLLRTQVLPRSLITGVAVILAPGGKGGSYYAPAVLLNDPEQKRWAINLWWLAALNERRAQVHADRVAALFTGAIATGEPGEP